MRTTLTIFVMLWTLAGAQGADSKSVEIDNVILLGEFKNASFPQVATDAIGKLKMEAPKGTLYLYAGDAGAKNIEIRYALAVGPGNLLADCILVTHEDLGNYWIIKDNRVIIIAAKQSLLGTRGVPEMIAFYCRAGFMPESVASIIGRRSMADGK